MRLRFLFLLSTIAISQLFGQTPIPLQFPFDPSRNTQAATFLRGSLLYGSLNDLLAGLKLKPELLTDARQMEFKTSLYSVRITAVNPYVAIVDRDSNVSCEQLSQNVLFGASSIFVPLEAFVPVLNTVTGQSIEYDESGHRITVGKEVPAPAFDLTGIGVEEKTNGLLVRIRCSRPMKDYESWVKPEGNDTWLYVTVADASADTTAIAATKPLGAMRHVLVFQSPTSVQFTVKLKGKYASPEPSQAENSDDILIALPNPPPEPPPKPTQDVGQTLEHERSKWKLDCIVIDAGHGGEDPGTIGVAHTKEKDVTLEVALKLGKLMEKNLAHTRVVYTRKKDEFIELFRRGQIANEAQGKLFISIHCNAAPRKPAPARGFEIYLLRPGKTENAVRIAERENDVVKFEKNYEERYQELTEERFILVTMAQSAYVKYSEQFADVLKQEMGKYLRQENTGVKQAGFYVLVGASMPNVLIETGYLSNRKEEQVLKSAKGQQRIAEAIFNAVKRYKQEYEKSLEEGKDMGAD